MQGFEEVKKSQRISTFFELECVKLNLFWAKNDGRKISRMRGNFHQRAAATVILEIAQIFEPVHLGLSNEISVCLHLV